MVTLHDGKPIVKVIDFGVAKAISQKLTEKTLFTAFGQMIGTPQYMSPEQAEMSGLDRAWASVKGAASGLVRVTGPEESATPLMTPEAAYFLRTNLTLQLQAARLALLRGEQAVFQQSLDDASAWLNQYYDTQSEQVASALQTIAEIRDAMFAVTTPDISESLRLLRQYETLAGSAQ